MKNNIIYSKKYPRIDLDLMDALTDGKISEGIKTMSSVEKCDKPYIPDPERENLKNRFIREAVEFSERHCIDLEITERDTFIQIDFSFDYMCCIKELINVFIMSDEINILTDIHDRQVTLMLTFNTHKSFY